MGLLNAIRDLFKSHTQEVILPVMTGGVGYMVAEERAYEGFLIITPNVIYYFPQTDLIRQGINNAKNLYQTDKVGGGNAALQEAQNFFIAAVQSPDNVLRISDLEEKLDAHIKHMKQERKDASFGEALPLPMRFERSGIEKIRVTFGGFTFDANFDDHEFKVSDREFLEGALKAGTYIS